MSCVCVCDFEYAGRNSVLIIKLQGNVCLLGENYKPLQMNNFQI